MKTSLLLLAALEASAVTAQRVMKAEFVKRLVPSGNVAPKSSAFTRRATVTEVLGNAEYLYYANVTVGTPPQMVQLQIDTGSSDIWMSASNAAYCAQAAGNCAGGTFNSAASSTFQMVNTLFNISYVDGTGSSGDYISDTLRIGGVSVTSQQMGLATVTTIGTGILGVGYPVDEAICRTIPCVGQYPTMVQNMVTQRLINSQAYSLWLDDLQSSTGSVLFGGVDTAKYSGSLVSLPIQPDSRLNIITSFTLAWTGFSIGGCSTFPASSFSVPAILDSGTTLTLVPDALFTSIANELGVQYSRNYQAYVLPCYLASYGATLDYQFGGASGPTIRVPVSEVILPLVLTNGATPKYSNGQAICQFGIEPAGTDPILLGDTFLRSAYVVYDLANNQISLAQTNFNANSSSVQEIVAGANGVPNVASTASAAGASATATGIPRSTVATSRGTAASATAGLSNSSPLACVGTNTVSGALGIAGATGTPARASVAASGSASASASRARAAAGLRAPVAGFEASVVSMLPVALVLGSALVGSGLLLL